MDEELVRRINNAMLRIEAAAEALHEVALVDDRLLDREQLAELLGYCVRHIDRLCRAGRLPEGIRIGRCPRWWLSEIRSHIENLNDQS